MKEDTRQERRSVRRGDVLYISRDSGPVCGDVLCHGQDGVTVRIDGEVAQVPWAGVLGHKQRMDVHAAVIDQGEDGAILEDEEGLRSYVHGLAYGDEGDEEEGEMSEPLTKAGPLANRPGLTLQEVSSKKGGQVHRWLRSGQEAPKDERKSAAQQSQAVKPGAVVSFRSSSGHPHSGKVIASGADGVTVQDDRGGEHRVKHGEYKAGHLGVKGEGQSSQTVENKGSAESAKGAEKQASSAQPAESAKEKEGVGPRDDNYHSPLREEHFSLPPKNASQPVDNSIDALYAHAKEAFPQYQDWAGKVASVLGAQVVDINKGEKPQLKAPGITYVIGPLKKEDRVKEKAEAEEGGDYTAIKDIIRGTIAIDGMDQLQKVWRAVESSFNGVRISRTPKDRFARPTPAGYRDILLNVSMPNGHVCELQINCKEMMEAKEVAHKLYEEQREIEGKIGKEKRRPSHAEALALEKLSAQQQKVYGDAWESITRGVKLAALAAGSAILFMAKRIAK